MIRVGVLGIGRMGMLHLFNTFKMKGVNVVAIADKNKTRLAKVTKPGINTYQEYQQLLDEEKLDAVIISLPNFLKETAAIEAVEKGIDVFIDKPLARNYAEAKRIAQKVDQTGNRFMVGANCRYFTSVMALKQLIDDGQIGEIPLTSAELVINGPFAHPIEPRPVPNWYFQPQISGGGALLDLGYHLIDLFNWFFHDVEVSYSQLGYAYRMPIEDMATVILRSNETSTIGTINVGWFCKLIFPDYNFRMNAHGTAGFASTDQFTPPNFYIHALKEGVRNLLRKIVFKPIHYLSYTFFYTSYYQILEAFFNALRLDQPLPIDIESQLTVMKIIDSIYHTPTGKVND